MKTRSTLRRLLAAAAGAMLATALVAIPTTPAHAQSRDGDCESGEVCIYRLAGLHPVDGMHDTGNFFYGNYSGRNYVVGSSASINDSASSLRNRDTMVGAWFYRTAEGGGGKLHVAVRGHRSNLAQDNFNTNVNADNRITSHCWIGRGPGWCD